MNLRDKIMDLLDYILLWILLYIFPYISILYFFSGPFFESYPWFCSYLLYLVFASSFYIFREAWKFLGLFFYFAGGTLIILLILSTLTHLFCFPLDIFPWFYYCKFILFWWLSSLIFTNFYKYEYVINILLTIQFFLYGLIGLLILITLVFLLDESINLFPWFYYSISTLFWVILSINHHLYKLNLFSLNYKQTYTFLLIHIYIYGFIAFLFLMTLTYLLDDSINMFPWFYYCISTLFWIILSLDYVYYRTKLFKFRKFSYVFLLMHFFIHRLIAFLFLITLTYLLDGSINTFPWFYYSIFILFWEMKSLDYVFNKIKLYKFKQFTYTFILTHFYLYGFIALLNLITLYYFMGYSISIFPWFYYCIFTLFWGTAGIVFLYYYRKEYEKN